MSDVDATDIHAHRASRLGLTLFAFYCLLYAGFIGLSTFSPAIVAMRPFGGLNLATIYGFGLIIVALLLACIYMWACRAGGAKR